MSESTPSTVGPPTRRWGPALLVPGLTFLMAMGLFGLFLQSFLSRQREERRSEALLQGDRVSKAIQKGLTDLYIATSEVDILLRTHRFEVAGFPAWAQDVLRRYPSVSVLQLAPGGIIQAVEPGQGFEPVLGRDLKTSKARKLGALEAIERRRVIFVGPVELSPVGKLSVIARRPVFLDAEAKQFWGFTIAIAYFDRIAQQELEGLNLRFHYQLVGHNPDAPESAVLTRSPGRALRDDLRLDVPVPGGSWFLRLEAQETRDPLLMALAAFGVAFSLALAWLASAWIRAQERERRGLEARNAELQAMAETDPLTGLFNRRAFLARARHALEPPTPADHGWACLFLDLDHFKRVNDGHGHAVGDLALQAVADALRQTIRRSDPMGRLGGEEFAVLIHSESLPQAAAVAEKVRLQVARVRLNLPCDEQGYSVSIGVAQWDLGEPVETLLGRADHAMYAAKRAGRNRVVCAEH